MPLRAFAEETVTVTDTATALTATTYNNPGTPATSGAEYASPPITATGRAQQAVVEVLSESIYYTLNGGTPTSADHVLNSGDQVTLDNHQHIAKFRAVRTAGTNAGLAVTYYN